MKTSLEIAKEITKDCSCRFCCCTADAVDAGEKKLALEFRELLARPIPSGEMLVIIARRCAEILNINDMTEASVKLEPNYIRSDLHGYLIMQALPEGGPFLLGGFDAQIPGRVLGIFDGTGHSESSYSDDNTGRYWKLRDGDYVALKTTDECKSRK